MCVPAVTAEWHRCFRQSLIYILSKKSRTHYVTHTVYSLLMMPEKNTCFPFSSQFSSMSYFVHTHTHFLSLSFTHYKAEHCCLEAKYLQWPNSRLWRISCTRATAKNGWNQHRHTLGKSGKEVDASWPNIAAAKHHHRVKECVCVCASRKWRLIICRAVQTTMVMQKNDDDEEEDERSC